MNSDLISPLLQGFALSAGLIVAIGAQNIFVLRQGLKGDYLLPVVLFCALADAILISAGVLGLGRVLTAVPHLSSTMALAGAAFLVWYGATAFYRSFHPHRMELEAGEKASLKRTMMTIAAFTLLNPHVYIDTVMLMGTVGSSLPVAQRPWFIAGAAGFSGLWFFGLGYGAGYLAPVFARPVAWRVLDGLTGAVMFTLAVVLLRGAFLA